MFGKRCSGSLSKIHSDPCQTSKMEIFAKIVNGQKHRLFSQIALSKRFDRVLKMLLILTGIVLTLLIRYLLVQS